jgi:hypothetical protein
VRNSDEIVIAVSSFWGSGYGDVTNFKAKKNLLAGLSKGKKRSRALRASLNFIENIFYAELAGTEALEISAE